MKNKFKTIFIRFILNVTGYNIPITLANFYHPGRKDTINLIDFVLNTSDNSRIIRVDADCSNAKCVCCKDKGVLKNVYNQIGHYNTYDRNKK